MRYLLAFLWKHNFFFLFVALELLAFILMTNSKNYQGSVIINATSEFTGGINNTATNIGNYFSLNKANEQLLKENTKLLQNSPETILISDSGFHYVDSLYRYIGAKVISISTHKRNNYMMLNRGSKHGIKKDMGVISGDGIVGTVISVSKNYSSVMLLLHKDAKISARIKKNNQLVNAVWNEIDYRFGTLEDIPAHLQLEAGDTIISSGNSFIFPKGIQIGTVTEYINTGGQSLNSAKIKYSTDFNALFYVYIIENLMKEEIIELAEENI